MDIYKTRALLVTMASRPPYLFLSIYIFLFKILFPFLFGKRGSYQAQTLGE